MGVTQTLHLLPPTGLQLVSLILRQRTLRLQHTRQQIAVTEQLGSQLVRRQTDRHRLARQRNTGQALHTIQRRPHNVHDVVVGVWSPLAGLNRLDIENLRCCRIVRINLTEMRLDTLRMNKPQSGDLTEPITNLMQIPVPPKENMVHTRFPQFDRCINRPGLAFQTSYRLSSRSAFAYTFNGKPPTTPDSRVTH